MTVKTNNVVSTDWVKHVITFDCGGSIWLKCMAGVCNKCRQAQPHLSDSWCLACSAHEALGNEFRSVWGQPGSRAIATDIICSSLRQVRALRRFGVAVAVKTGSTPLEGASLHPSSKSSGAEPRETGTGPILTPAPHVKEEESQESESGSSEPEEPQESAKEEKKVTEDAAHKTTAAKSKAKQERSPVPRRRQEERARSDEGKERKKKRSPSSARSHEGRRHQVPEGPRSSRDHWRHPESERDRRHSHKKEKVDRRERKRYRPGHRGGSRHQKLEKGLEDPYRRFHLPQPDAFWDGQHANIYPAQW